MSKLLVVLVVILAVIAIAQLARVYELTSSLKSKRDEDISHADNKMNAFFMLLFMIAMYVFFFWQYFAYGDKLLPPPASVHGVETDWLLKFNFYIIMAVFFLTNTLLFWFSFKYYYRADRKAYFYPHNNKLEIIWTIIPTVVLGVIIIFGLRTWNNITAPAQPDAVVIELYAKQFDWTARYPGEDLQLGAANFNLINNDNPLGLINKDQIDKQIASLKEEIAGYQARLENEVLPDNAVEELEDKIGKRQRQIARIQDLKTDKSGMIEYDNANDDKLVKGEFHIPVGREIKFVFRAQDVLHSAYMPHLRSQMNCVPGRATTLKVTPTITTDSMRIIMNNPNFNYVLLCNKICGASHYNMQMDYVVESEEDYNAWLKEQKTFVEVEVPEMDSTKAIVEVSN